MMANNWLIVCLLFVQVCLLLLTFLVHLLLLVRRLGGKLRMIAMLMNVTAWMSSCPVGTGLAPVRALASAFARLGVCLYVHANIVLHLAKPCAIESGDSVALGKQILTVYLE